MPRKYIPVADDKRKRAKKGTMVGSVVVPLDGETLLMLMSGAEDEGVAPVEWVRRAIRERAAKGW